MNSDMPTLLGVLINWFPMFVIVGVWVWVILRIRSGKLGGTYQKDVLEAYRLQTTALERIAQALEDKNRHG